MLILLCFQIKVLNYYEITKRKTAAATAQTAVLSTLCCSRLACSSAAVIFIYHLSINKLNSMAAQNLNATANKYNGLRKQTNEMNFTYYS